MENKVIHRNNQELQSEDLNDSQDFAQAALDHVILDTIEDGRAYSGFTIAKTGAAEVTLDPGRLYASGAVYAREDSVIIDLFNSIPLVTKKRVAIVAYGQTIEDDVQPRDFLINADTGATEPQSVPMVQSRRCEVNAVAGQEAADPTYPTVDVNLTVLAYVLLDTTGVVEVEQWEQTQVNNLGDVADRTSSIEAWRSDISGQVDTLKTDLAGISMKLGSFALSVQLAELAKRIAELEKNQSQPASFLYHGINKFVDEADANKLASGYAATVDQGLRFPYAATSSTTLTLLNPNDPFVITSGGVTNPAFVMALRYDCRGYSRQHRCGQHTWQAHQVDLLSFTRHRIRVGPEWIGEGRAKWVVNELDDALKTVFYRNDGTWNDKTLRQYIAATKSIYDQKAWIKVAYSRGGWEDMCEDYYWDHIRSSSTVTAYHVAQTFLASQDMLVMKVGLYFSQAAASGDVDVMICETKQNGEPMLDRVVSKSTLTRAYIKLGTGSGGAGLPSVVESTVGMSAANLQAGKRYALVLAVKGDHWLACSDSDFGVFQGPSWAHQSGAWSALQGQFKARIYVASWADARMVVNLTPLQLAGGIRSLEFHGEVVMPGQTRVVYEVQVGGVWKPVDNDLDLSSLPAVLPCRAVFMGSRDLMPSIRLDRVNVHCRRQATALKYVSKTRALGSNAAKIVIDLIVDGFDDAVHDLTVTVMTNAGGTTETADTVADTTLLDGTILRRSTFNITADNDYFYVIDGTLASMNAQYVITQAEDVATA